MATELRDRIGELDDFQVVRFLNHFSQEVFQGLEVTTDEVLGDVPDEVRALPGFSRIEGLTADERTANLPASEAPEVARSLLMAFADDPAFAPALEASLDAYKDDDMAVGVILAIGFAATMILIASTTKAKGKIGPIEIDKEAASVDLVKAVLAPFSKALDLIGGGK